MWTSEIIFNRERFEAWLASQPGQRQFFYYSSCRCACASFVRETSNISNPFVGGASLTIGLEDSREIEIPSWLRALLSEVPDYFTITSLRNTYQKLFGIDVCAEYPTVQLPATKPATA